MKTINKKFAMLLKTFLLTGMLLLLPAVFGNNVCSAAISPELDEAIQQLLENIVEKTNRTMVVDEAEYATIMVNKRGKPLKEGLTYEQFQEFFTQSQFVFKDEMDSNMYNSVQSVLEDALESALGADLTETQLIEMINPPEGSIYSYEGVPSLLDEVIKTLAVSIDWNGGLCVNGTFCWYIGAITPALPETFPTVVQDEVQKIQEQIVKKEDRILRSLRKEVKDARTALQNLHATLSGDQSIPVAEPDWTALGFDVDLRNVTTYAELDAMSTTIDIAQTDLQVEADQIVADKLTEVNAANVELQATDLGGAPVTIAQFDTTGMTYIDLLDIQDQIVAEVIRVEEAVETYNATLDTDGDGVIDSQDAFPDDPTENY